MMRKAFIGTALLLAVVGAQMASGSIALFGVVPAETQGETLRQAGAPYGVLARFVGPGAPADKAGIRKGDLLIRFNGQPLRSEEDLRRLLALCSPGDVVSVELVSAGKPRSVLVTLSEKKRLSTNKVSVSQAVRGDRIARQHRVPEEILAKVKEKKQAVCERFSGLPDAFEPREVTELLQSIRNLARDMNREREGWMVGQAGEVTIQFKDEEGSILLHGANKLLSIEVYDASGRLIYASGLNTPEQRRSLPPHVLERCRRLRDSE